MNELPFIHIFSYCFFQIYCLWLYLGSLVDDFPFNRALFNRSHFCEDVGVEQNNQQTCFQC